MDERKFGNEPSNAEIKNAVKVERKETSQGGVDKITLPYVDWRIDPSHLNFDEIDFPCALKDTFYTKQIYDNKTYLLYKGVVLGEGTFGAVYLALDIEKKEWIAIKILNPKKIDERFSPKKESEKLEETENLAFFDEDKNVIGMKLLEGFALSKAICDPSQNHQAPRQNFSLLQKLVIAKNILKKAAGLHHDVRYMKGKVGEKRIIFHRDIKSENICLDPSTLNIAYCDFGLAAILSEEKSVVPIKDRIKEEDLDPKHVREKALEDDKVGTPSFMAPEIFYSKKNRSVVYNEATEVFALGQVLVDIFELDSDSFGYYNNKHLPEDLFNLIVSMVDDYPKRRPTVLVAAQKLNAILRDVGKNEKYSSKVCVISIDDFLKKDKNQKGKLIGKILSKKINAVVLQGSEQTSYQDYYKVRHQLIRNGIINIAPFMAKGDSQDAICRVVKDHYDERLATLNTQVFVYNSNNNKLEEKLVKPKPSKPSFFKNHPILTGVLIGLGVTVLGAAAVTAVVFSGGIAIAGIAGAAAAAGSFIMGGAAAGTTATIVGAAAIVSGSVIAGVALGAAGGAIAQNISSKKPDNSPQEEKKISIDEKNKPESKKEIQAKQEELPNQEKVNPSKQEVSASLTHNSMFSKKITEQEIDDINIVIVFLAKNISFFTALCQDQEAFSQWASSKSDAKSLFSDLMIFIKSSKEDDISAFQQFKDSILGNEEKKGLLDGNDIWIKELLTNNNILRRALKKHMDNPVIDAWYQDNNLAKQRSVIRPFS